MTHESPGGIAPRLIVNADDYGWTEGISAGIRDAHRRGIVTSTSVLMNFPGVEEELTRARTECPTLGLGVHLNFTAGRPLADARRVPSLVGSGGEFRSPREALFAADPEELECEFRCQIDRFVGAAGQPTHLDSHQHLASLMPRYFEVLARLALELGVPARTFPTVESRAAAAPGLEGFHGELMRIREEHAIAAVDHLEAGFYSDGACLDNLVRILRNLKPGITELVCHPGFQSEERAGPPRRRIPDRQGEWEVLIHPAAREALHDGHVELVSFAIFSPCRGRADLPWRTPSTG